MQQHAFSRSLARGHVTIATHLNQKHFIPSVDTATHHYTSLKFSFSNPVRRKHSCFMPALILLLLQGLLVFSFLSFLAFSL
jgi:hypothetical protein